MNVSGYYVGWYEGKALGDYYVCRYMGMVTTNVGWVLILHITVGFGL